MTEGSKNFLDIAEAKRKREKGAEPEEKKETTLSEIMRNDKQNALFGDMLARGDKKSQELAGRVMEKTLKPEDMDDLNKQRERFLEKMKQAEEMIKSLKPETIKSVAEYNPFLKNIISQIGAESVHGVIEAHAKRLAIENEKEFTVLTEKLSAMKKLEDDGEKLYKKIKDATRLFGGEHDSSMETQLHDVLSMEPGADRERILRDMVTRKGGVRGFLASTRETNKTNRVNEILSNGDLKDLSEAFVQLEDRKKQLGGALEDSLKKHGPTWKAVVEVMTGKDVRDAVDTDHGMTIEDTKEMMSLGKDQLQAEYDQFKTAHADDPDFMATSHRTQKQKMFENSYYKEHASKQRGWFETGKRIFRGTMNLLNY